VLILYLGEHGPVTKREPQIQQPFGSRTYRGEQVIWNLEQETYIKHTAGNRSSGTWNRNHMRGTGHLEPGTGNIYKAHCGEQIIWNQEQETYTKHTAGNR
jgi:hypothetical protein